ncbi:hypothetical protein [Deinococcus wulumuqiensis]|uniref:hypothetical protein n=1 Tax=Deinococcus wulumuqiensis TaxID=980427 RepID=UPI003C6C73BF
MLLFTGSLAAAQAAPKGVSTIRFLDVGQGDAVLITAPEGQSLMYDGGRSESRMRSTAPLSLDDLSAEINALLRRAGAPFVLGDSVRKRPGGGAWHGAAVGVYLASKTPLGFAIESVSEPGSVQIYPAKALEEWDGQS